MGNFNENGVASDILTLLAREVSIWFAFPLIKSLLAVVINDIESKGGRQKNDRVKEESLLQLDKALSYFVRALILPTKLMCCTMKVVASVSVHEAGVLLGNLWKYLADVAPTHQALMVDRTVSAVRDFGRFGPKTLKAAVPWKQTITYLIQKYVKDLGHFVQLLKREGFLVDEEDSDDWDIEYKPPFLFMPDMKR
uniref:INTS5_C domain-containing protein n=1 Tax=Steinernema glaseri TaxID=37863 RepID=A0A1I7Y4T1_9BILA